MLEISEDLCEVNVILVDLVLNSTMGTIFKEYMDDDLDKCKRSSNFHCWYYRWCGLIVFIRIFSCRVFSSNTVEFG